MSRCCAGCALGKARLQRGSVGVCGAVWCPSVLVPPSRALKEQQRGRLGGDAVRGSFPCLASWVPRPPRRVGVPARAGIAEPCAVGSGQAGELRLMSCLHEGERGPVPGQGLSDLGGHQSRGREQHEELGSTERCCSRPVSTSLVPESVWVLTAGVLPWGEREQGALAGRRAACEMLRWLPSDMAGGQRAGPLRGLCLRWTGS